MILPILGGALLFGVAAAGMLVHVNSALGGRDNGVLVVRANLWSVVGATIGPLVLSAAARSVGWSLGALVPVPLLLALVLVLPASPARDTVLAGDREPPLGRPYWLTWLYLVLCIGAEFSFVAWGAQVAVARVDIPLADATALGSLFILGQVLGRIGLGAGGGLAIEARRLLAVMVAATLAGGLLVGLAGTALVAGLGLLVGGLGLAGVWATTAGVAILNAPGAPVTASARLNLASGVPILLVPTALGVAAGAAGVLAAWGLVLALMVIALLVLRLIPGAAPSEAAEAAPGPA